MDVRFGTGDSARFAILLAPYRRDLASPVYALTIKLDALNFDHSQSIVISEQGMRHLVLPNGTFMFGTIPIKNTKTHA